MFNNIDSPYGADSDLARIINERGIDPAPEPDARIVPLNQRG
jgi:hypothetical protein